MSEVAPTATEPAAGVTASRLSAGLLSLLNDAMPHRLVTVLRGFLVHDAGAVEVGVLLADYELRELRRLSPRAGESLTVPVAGTAAGQCFVSQAVVATPGTRHDAGLDAEEDGAGGRDDGPDLTIVHVPLSLRAERLGVLQVTFREPVSTGLLRALQDVALTTAYVLVACGACSDVVEAARRAEPLSVAAEMQWNLQPLRAFSAPEFSIAGQLIPSYEVGGDCFDYSVEPGHLHLSSMDAMGHGVRASVLAALATAVMRNARRAGGGPVQQVSAADSQLVGHFDGAQFVTALSMRLDLRTGHVVAVNAGHPSPWLVRDGQATEVELAPQLPAGMFETTRYLEQQIQLRPGDRLVLVTDGLLEAGAPGAEFGDDRLSGLLLATAGLTPHQCVADVLHTVRSFAPRMHDDATVICLDWTGPPPQHG